MSVLPEARIARGFAGVRAMHDVTEGGLATALRELAAATGRGVLVHRDRIPVSAGTRRICDLLGADPLGLIASGSLLVCCGPDEAPALLAALAAAGIAAPTSASSTKTAPGWSRWSAACRRRGRTSRPTRPRACWRAGGGEG